MLACMTDDDDLLAAWEALVLVGYASIMKQLQYFELSLWSIQALRLKANMQPAGRRLERADFGHSSGLCERKRTGPPV